MAPMVSMKFTGGRELEAALRQLPKAVGRSAVESALKDVAKPIAEDMRQHAPKDTGEGAASIAATVAKIEGQTVTVAIGPDRDHFYLMFAEFGTVRQPARPFARPAWDAGKDGALKGLGRALWARLAAAAQRYAKRASS